MAYQQYQSPAGLLVNYRPVGGSWMTPVLLEASGPVGAAASPTGTFVVASGDAVFTWAVGNPAWEKTSFPSVSGVAAASGLAIAAVGPEISISTAVIP